MDPGAEQKAYCEFTHL